MLDLCYDVGLVLDIKFNAKKSSLLQVGRHFSSLIINLHVGCHDITWKDNLRYLLHGFTKVKSCLAILIMQ